jgi:chaperonin GroES
MLHNRVLVEPDPRQEMTSFGILIPDNKERPVTGTVVIGNSSVKEGDRILFSLFGLDEVKIDGKDYAVVSDSGILFIYA